MDRKLFVGGFYSENLKRTGDMANTRGLGVNARVSSLLDVLGFVDTVTFASFLFERYEVEDMQELTVEELSKALVEYFENDALFELTLFSNEDEALNYALENITEEMSQC